MLGVVLADFCADTKKKNKNLLPENSSAIAAAELGLVKRAVWTGVPHIIINSLRVNKANQMRDVLRIALNNKYIIPL